MKCALYLLLFAGCLAITIGVVVLFMTFSNEHTSIGLRSVGVLFLAAGIFGLLTGSMVKYGSRRICRDNNQPNQSTNRRSGDRDDAVYVEINGAISRVPFRYPVYNEYFYHIVNRMKQPVYMPSAPPSYNEVVKDTKGKEFSFVKCDNLPSPPLNSSPPLNPPPYHLHEQSATVVQMNQPFRKVDSLKMV